MKFTRGDRVRILLNTSYRHYLAGLEGTITAVLNHAAVVLLDNPPGTIQRIVGPSTDPSGAGSVGPKVPVPQQLMFQFHELEKIV